MKIALASIPVKNRNISFNIQNMLDAIQACTGLADIILFGESVLQGFDCLSWDYKADCSVAVTLADLPIRLLCEAAKKNRIAVSFGFIEREKECLYSSQVFIDADGRIMNVFHRVSIGWKDCSRTDTHYCEGTNFHSFSYGGKNFAIGLCGDLWTDGRPAEMKALNVNVILWPVWCDYDADDWNQDIKYEYAAQAGLCGRDVCLVNPFCADVGAECRSVGGSVHFHEGRIVSEHPAGTAGILIVDI